MRPELQKKIDQSIRILRMMSNAYGGVMELGYSGGKDSDVILQLAREAGIPIRPIYKCTTIDPPGTIKHAQEMGVEIIRPKQTFAQLVAKKGMPNRQRRFCCDVLKEYKIMDKVIIGVRREESAKRAERYKEPTACRVYGEGCETEQSIQPINNLKAWLQRLGIDAATIQSMVVPVIQSSMTQNPRVLELEDMIKSNEQLLLFSESPLLPWAVGNCAVEANNSDLRRLIKSGPHAKIDPVAGLENAIYCFDLSEGRIQ